jgi:hypothetical protein
MPKKKYSVHDIFENEPFMAEPEESPAQIEYLPFLEPLGISATAKERLSNSLKALLFHDPVLTVKKLGPDLAPVLRGIFLNVCSGLGDGWDLVRIYQEEYLRGLETHQAAKH